MESGFDSSWTWAVGLISFVLGLAIGAAVGFVSRKRGGRVHALEQELSTLRQQFDDYRQEVSHHFRTTSELVQKMSNSYREVYTHLASGSEALCQTKLDTPGLEFATPPAPDADPPELAQQPIEPPSSEGEDAEAADPSGDSCIGDAPHVPELDIHDPPNPARKP